ncbi:MAG: hypothetical protein RLZ35_411 [Pseudomonadota bacterium]|jgi:predicted HicB family RNase H-like nuclease
MELHYKGFSARVRYSACTEGFYGEAMHVDGVIAFQTSDLNAVESAFQEAVEYYLQHTRLLLCSLQRQFP